MSLRREEIGFIHVVASVTGFVIGAGILGLPIKFGECGIGFLPGAILIVICGIFQIATAIFLLYVMKALGPGEYTYYVLRLLGRGWWIALYLSVALYAFGALEAYVNYGGKAIEVLTNGVISKPLGMAIYWLAGSIIAFLGARVLGNAEAVLVTIFFVLLAAIVGLCIASPSFSIRNLEWMDMSKIFAGFGVTLFAYAAHFAIPSIGRHFKGEFRKLVLGVVLGFVAPMIGYIAWTAGFMGLLSPEDYTRVKGLAAPIAVAVLHKVEGFIAVLGYCFGFLTTFTSYVVALYSLARITHEFLSQLLSRKPSLDTTFWIVALLVLIVDLAAPITFLGWLDIAGGFGAPLFSGIIPSLLIIAAARRKYLEISKTMEIAIYITLAFYVLGTSIFIYNNYVELSSQRSSSIRA